RAARSSTGPSSSLLARTVDQLRHAIEFLTGDLEARALQQGHHRARGRSVEEGGQQVLDRPPAGALARQLRPVDVTLAIEGMTQESLLLEDPQRGPHRRVARRIRQATAHLAGRGAPGAVDDVHHLALAPTQGSQLLHPASAVKCLARAKSLAP